MSSPFAGVPLEWSIVLAIGLVVIVSMLGWAAVLFVRGQRARVRAPQPPPQGADAFTWVFLVPALNEQVTIRDSVERLAEVPVARRFIVAIDDGSDDDTPHILRELRAEHPDLVVLRRDRPDARVGKAAALNHAYAQLGGLLGDTPRDEVIVTIVDADGRLAPDAPRWTSAHFADAHVGGVQSRVRIYNRSHWLAWMQDVEFSVYGALYQAGRNGWGTAGMGGNGQFNRLSALDSIADHRGPWRDRLTEDQDLGLRLIAAGWHGRQELRGAVHQQGLSALRPLFRQRTRWSQGNLQAMSLTGSVWHAPIGWVPRAEQLGYLLMPLWQAVVGFALLVALALWIFDVVPLWGEGASAWQLVWVYLFAFGGVVLGCVAGRAEFGPRGWITGFLIAHPYALYTWLLWPVLVRSAARQLSARSEWAKTEREPLRRGGGELTQTPDAGATVGDPALTTGAAEVTTASLPR